MYLIHASIYMPSIFAHYTCKNNSHFLTLICFHVYKILNKLAAYRIQTNFVTTERIVVMQEYQWKEFCLHARNCFATMCVSRDQFDLG